MLGIREKLMGISKAEIKEADRVNAAARQHEQAVRDTKLARVLLAECNKRQPSAIGRCSDPSQVDLLPTTEEAEGRFRQELSLPEAVNVRKLRLGFSPLQVTDRLFTLSYDQGKPDFLALSKFLVNSGTVHNPTQGVTGFQVEDNDGRGINTVVAVGSEDYRVIYSTISLFLPTIIDQVAADGDIPNA